MTCSTNPTRRRFLALSAGAAVAALPSLAPVSVLAGQAIPAPDFGVTPGSGIDQTAALQHAIDEARRADMPLFLPPGRYEISRLSLATGARLIGVAGATRLVSHTSGSLMAAAGAGHVSVRGIVFDGAGIGGGPDALVRLADVRRAEITDCEIIGSAGSGIDLANCGGRIAGNRFSGMARVAIHSLDGSELDILDNEIAGCGDNGIRVWQSEKRTDGARVTGNRISNIRARSGGTGQNGNGINIFRAGDVTVSNNVISNCAFSAIRNNSGDNILISNNSCRNLEEVAIYSEFGFEGAVIAQNTVDGAALGISVVNFNEGGRLAAVTGNLIRNIEIGGYPEERGIGIAVEADAAVSGNVIENCAFSAINLGHGPYLRDVAATGNVLRRAPYGIAVSVAPGAGTALIADNLLAEMSRGAIVAMEWGDVVASDLADGDGARFPHLTIRGNRVA